MPGIWKRAALLAIGAILSAGAAEPYPSPPPDQAAQYEAAVPKSIIELQPFRRIKSATINGLGEATLIELNPYINSWFLLTLEDGEKSTTFHLQNSRPDEQHLRLTANALVITDDDGQVACDLWSGAPSPLQEASDSGLPYAPLCGERLYVRNPVAGRRTDLERVAELLRDHVWGGDAIVGFVGRHLFRDAYREEGTAGGSLGAPAGGEPGPMPAAVSAAYAGRTVVPEHLGIDVVGASSSGELALGRWYPAQDRSGVYLSVIRPQAVAPEILESHPGRADRLDAVEASALDYLVAFDLAQLDLGFALGTGHPRVGWSPRPPEGMRPPGLPGPDGIADTAPLVTNGMVTPARVERTVAVFTGGFKREHGAFKYGELAGINRGSHYGFIEEGVVFSKLQPGLATLYVLDDGSIHMETWSETDDRLLGRIRYARQNGVALVEPDPATGAPAPGPLVARWGPGNWSGSAAGELRALRAGACLQESGAGGFLIYGYFSTATPSAMARVFQAYGCTYAMLLDMNALEHTYLALYVRRGEEVVVEHLIQGMAEVDRSAGGRMVPRFIGFPDNRDFFYLMWQEGHP